MSDFFTWSVDAATVIGPESQLENPVRWYSFMVQKQAMNDAGCIECGKW